MGDADVSLFRKVSNQHLKVQLLCVAKQGSFLTFSPILTSTLISYIYLRNLAESCTCPNGEFWIRCRQTDLLQFYKQGKSIFMTGKLSFEILNFVLAGTSTARTRNYLSHEEGSSDSVLCLFICVGLNLPTHVCVRTCVSECVFVFLYQSVHYLSISLILSIYLSLIIYLCFVPMGVTGQVSNGNNGNGNNDEDGYDAND